MTLEENVKLLKPEFFDKKCYTCIHRRSIPGDTHSSCACKTALTKLNPHGVKNGWAMYPFNFDPIWIDVCDSHQMKDKSFDEVEDLETLAKEYIKFIVSKFNYLGNEGSVEFKTTAIEIGNKLNSVLDTYKKDSTKEELKNMLIELYKI